MPFPFARPLSVAGLFASLLIASAQARTWTDSQGRTLEADYVDSTATDVTVRRADGRVFALALSTLAAADCEFVAAQKPSPGRDFKDVNTLLGVDLLADESLWDDTPSDAARRLRLPLEGKAGGMEGYRAYPKKPVPVLGAEAHMLALQAADDRITTITVQFANRGDYPAFRDRDPRMSPGKAELQEFEKALRRDFDRLTSALTARFGEPKREIPVGGLDAGRRVLRWEWNGHAFLASHDAEQMVFLKIVPTGATANARLSDDQVRRMFKERITRRENGDVILDRIPMVNQGPKGYCVPATFERYLRYAGIPADMYELAATGGTDFGCGTSFQGMARSLDRYVRRQGRRLESVTPKLTAAGIARYIDEGRPIIWGLYSTPAFNEFSNAHSEARSRESATTSSKITVPSGVLATIKPESSTSHACLIIGYNRATDEIAFTDSWGPRFVERWAPASVLQKITLDEYWVLAW